MARTNSILAVALASVIIVAACGGNSGGSSDAGPDGGSDAGGGDAGTDAGGSDAGHDGGTDGGSDAGSDGGTDGGDGGSASPVVLDSATAHVVGRHGRDIRITLTGQDTNKDISAVMVRLLDSSGNPVLGFDSHQSGTDDSELGPATFDTTVLGLGTISTTATLSGLAASQPTVAKVAVSLRDIYGVASNEIIAAVVAQSTAASGATCDINYVTSRCPDTFYCTGSTPTCQAAPAPQITQLAYLTTDAGSTILIRGTEPDDDISNMNIAFEDGGGQPLSIPLDGDNAPPVASFDSSAVGDSDQGQFFVVIEPAADFSSLCPQIAVTPSDTAGLTGDVVSAKPVAIPVINSGSTCDTQGFNVCAAATVCALAPSGSVYTCQSLSTQQTAVCHGAPVLAPTAGNDAVTFAHTGKAAYWNVPVGCSSTDPVGTPLGVATLHLASDAATLTLSTDNPGTDYDTVLYLLPDCPADSSGALGCDDDTSVGATSILTLQSVPAGDYTVVIGSFNSGGNYQLTASVQ